MRTKIYREVINEHKNDAEFPRLIELLLKIFNRYGALDGVHADDTQKEPIKKAGFKYHNFISENIFHYDYCIPTSKINDFFGIKIAGCAVDSVELIEKIIDDLKVNKPPKDIK